MTASESVTNYTSKTQASTVIWHTELFTNPFDLASEVGDIPPAYIVFLPVNTVMIPLSSGKDISLGEISNESVFSSPAFK